MVTSVGLERLRNMSFGWSAIPNPVDRTLVLSEIRKYDAQDAALVSAHIRESAGLSTAATTLVKMYQDAIEKFCGTNRRDPEQELRACAGFLQDIAPFSNTFYLEEQLRRTELLANALATVPLPECERSKIRIANASGPDSLTLGQVSNMTVQLENASNSCIASYPPYPIYASFRWLDDDSGDVRLFEGSRTEIFPPLMSGQSYRYKVKVQAPNIPGRYRLRLTLVQEAIAWFDTGDAPCFFDVPILVE